MGQVPRVAILALAVALVLADSSVVTLGLPSILADLDTTPEGVSWVLTGYNLVLALAALPAARLVGLRGAAPVAAAGLVVFAVASLICAVAGSLGVLIAARCLQGLGGAAVACAALPLLSAAEHSPGLGARVWGASGAVGAALGPAAGGVLTEAFSWEAIFVVQVPIALLCLAGVTAPRRVAAAARAGEERAPADDAWVGGVGAGGEVALEGPLWSRAAGWQERDVVTGRGRGVPGDIREDPGRPHHGGAPPAASRDTERRDRPDARSLTALAFLGAGLTAALFLLVLLLIAGWRHSPIAAAVTVTVMPAAALLAGRLSAGLDTRTRAGTGAILVAGGLAALAFLPGSSLAWTVPPQILIGLGLGMSLAALTEEALGDRRPQAWHGGWTITARHVGVVVALALLTPIFVGDLEDQQQRTQESILAAILDSPVGTSTKLALGVELAKQLQRAEGEVPEPGDSFARARPSGEDRAEFDDLTAEIEGELDRAAKSAFTRSFLIGALLSLGALIPLLLSPRRRPA
jgi:MFS family permease